MKKMLVSALFLGVALQSAFAGSFNGEGFGFNDPFGPPAPVRYRGPKVERELQSKLSLARKGQTFTVLVTAKDPELSLPPSLSQEERVARHDAALKKTVNLIAAAVKRAATKGEVGIVQDKLEKLGIVLVTATPKVIQTLAKRADVLVISEERHYSLAGGGASIQ